MPHHAAKIHECRGIVPALAAVESRAAESIAIAHIAALHARSIMHIFLGLHEIALLFLAVAAQAEQPGDSRAKIPRAKSVAQQSELPSELLLRGYSVTTQALLYVLEQVEAGTVKDRASAASLAKDTIERLQRVPAAFEAG